MIRNVEAMLNVQVEETGRRDRGRECVWYLGMHHPVRSTSSVNSRGVLCCCSIKIDQTKLAE
jgi:hypothetical protein